MRIRFTLLALSLLALLLSTACRPANPDVLPTAAVIATVPPITEPTAAGPTRLPIATITAEPTAEPTTAVIVTVPPTAEPSAEPDAPPLPAGVFYDLGEAIILQENFAEDSRFRRMPVQLNGVMAVPDSGEGPFPVVLFLHGSHPGCPLVGEVDQWPCGDAEQRNYAGFEYLVRELAARGYVALSININAENTFGFGEPFPGERLRQIVDLHLSALAAAAAGGENNFGVELAGVADVSQLVLMGHSRGGEGANWLATDVGLDQDTAAAERGYGPVRGLLLVAPAMSFVGTNGTNVPLAVILPACDGDVMDQAGQLFYEAVRLGEWSATAARPNAPATSVFLERANHNGFNSQLSGDMVVMDDREDCRPLQTPAEQQSFLVDYAADFLMSLFDSDPTARLAAAARLGMDPLAAAPDDILGRPARVSVIPAAADRLPIWTPATEADMTTNRLGGAITAEGLTTLFCRQGYFLPADVPGSEPCRRPTLTVPAYPNMAVVDWAEPGGALRFELPEGQRDLSRYDALSLRAVVDPLSALNAVGATQRLSVRLTDGAGAVAVVATGDEPALRYPVGDIFEDGFFGPTFTGRAPLTTLRLPLAGFGGVNLADVTEIALLFDQSLSGTLLLGDLEVIRRPDVVVE